MSQFSSCRQERVSVQQSPRQSGSQFQVANQPVCPPRAQGASAAQQTEEQSVVKGLINLWLPSLLQTLSMLNISARRKIFCFRVPSRRGVRTTSPAFLVEVLSAGAPGVAIQAWTRLLESRPAWWPTCRAVQVESTTSLPQPTLLPSADRSLRRIHLVQDQPHSAAKAPAQSRPLIAEIQSSRPA